MRNPESYQASALGMSIVITARPPFGQLDRANKSSVLSAPYSRGARSRSGGSYCYDTCKVSSLRFHVSTQTVRSTSPQSHFSLERELQSVESLGQRTEK